MGRWEKKVKYCSQNWSCCQIIWWIHCDKWTRNKYICEDNRSSDWSFCSKIRPSHGQYYYSNESGVCLMLFHQSRAASSNMTSLNSLSSSLSHLINTSLSKRIVTLRGGHQQTTTSLTYQRKVLTLIIFSSLPVLVVCHNISLVCLLLWVRSAFLWWQENEILAWFDRPTPMCQCIDTNHK